MLPKEQLPRRISIFLLSLVVGVCIVLSSSTLPKDGLTSFWISQCDGTTISRPPNATLHSSTTDGSVKSAWARLSSQPAKVMLTTPPLKSLEVTTSFLPPKVASIFSELSVIMEERILKFGGQYLSFAVRKPVPCHCIVNILGNIA